MKEIYRMAISITIMILEMDNNNPQIDINEVYKDVLVKHGSHDSSKYQFKEKNSFYKTEQQILWYKIMTSNYVH